MSAFDQRVCEWLNTATIPPNKKQTVLNRISVSISNYRALEIDKAHPGAVANTGGSGGNPAAGGTPATGNSVAPTPRGTPKTPLNTGRKTLVATPASARAGKSSARGSSSPLSPHAKDNSPSRASVMSGFTQPQLEVDYALQQRIAKALRRLQEGDEGTETSPLFVVSPHKYADPNVDDEDYDVVGHDQVEGDNSADEGPVGDEDVDDAHDDTNDTPNGENSVKNNMYDDEVDDQNQPFGAPENETGAYSVGFTFGDAADDDFVGTNGRGDDEGEHHNEEDDTAMTVQEDARRRLTMKRKSRNAISAETVDPEAAMAFTAETVPKDPHYRQTIINSLETHHLFSHLDDDDLAFVADIMTIHTFAEGEDIVSKLDTCDEMLIIVDGEAVITETTTAEEFEEYSGEAHKKVGAIRKDANNAINGGSNASNDSVNAANAEAAANRNGTHLKVGATVGDLGLMYHTVQPETVVSVSPSSGLTTSSATTTSSHLGADVATICCGISRNAYKNICAKASKIKRERYESFLSNVKFLQGLTKEERLRLADALKSAKYNQGEKIIKYGEEGVWFNIILDGRVDVIGRDENGQNVNVCSFKEGDSVGELEFIFGHKTVADCVAGTAIVKTAKMTANHFEKVIGPAKEVLERKANDDQVYSYYRQTNKVK